ncbi:MAG: MoxR family ATPase [Pseudomonadota bacterium]
MAQELYENQDFPVLKPLELREFLLDVTLTSPVFIWGPPGIGKSAIVESVAEQMGLECVSLLGSQLAPEDVMGIPQISDGRSQFCPPKIIARDNAYCLFLDEFNVCSPDVQKSFYSIIHDRRIADYTLPAGSAIICAGNRPKDVSITRPLSSALINRLVHVHMETRVDEWMEWAEANNLHFLILQYIREHPEQLWEEPTKDQTPYSTPRAWHILSNALKRMGSEANRVKVEALAYGCLSLPHARQFKVEVLEQAIDQPTIAAIMAGEAQWPNKDKDRGLLIYLAHTFREFLVQELPDNEMGIMESHSQIIRQGKKIFLDLVKVDPEIARGLLVADGRHKPLPEWFVSNLREAIPELANI